MGSGGPTVGMDASGLTTARMVVIGFQISLLLLLSGHTHALKNCDNCVAVDDCRRWCTKLQMGLSNLTLDERAEFNDNICGFDSNADPAVKLCCDSPAEKDACKKAKCGQVLVEGDAQCGGCDDVSSPGAWPWVTRILYQANFDSADNNETTYLATRMPPVPLPCSPPCRLAPSRLPLRPTRARSSATPAVCRALAVAPVSTT